MGPALNLAFDLLAVTSIMVLAVMGLGIVASMMRVFNFAHGEFLLLGAFTVWRAHEAGLPVWLGIVAAPFIVALIGLVIEQTVVRRLV